MEVEQKMVTLPLNEQLQTQVQELVKEGWQINPSAPPVVVYHLVRPKQQEAAPSMGFKMQINDDLITVVKAPQQ